MQMHTHHPLPQAKLMASMSVDELIRTTLRLSNLMQEESELLQANRFKELPKLQEEKMRLTTVLELYQQRLASDPGFIQQADAASREELLLLTDDLAFAVEENFRQVSTAKAVNARVMQAIMDVMSDQHRPSTYGRNGTSAHSADMSLSMNLDQRA